MIDCPQCGGRVDGLFCLRCGEGSPRPARPPIPSHVRAVLERVKARGREPTARQREPGDDDEVTK